MRIELNVVKLLILLKFSKEKVGYYVILMFKLISDY